MLYLVSTGYSDYTLLMEEKNKKLKNLIKKKKPNRKIPRMSRIISTVLSVTTGTLAMIPSINQNTSL